MSRGTSRGLAIALLTAIGAFGCGGGTEGQTDAGSDGGSGEDVTPTPDGSPGQAVWDQAKWDESTWN